MYPKKNAPCGFTLLEILVALFIFTLVSMMLMQGLRRMIMIQSDTEAKAQWLREYQRGFLILSRDVEQTVDRPIIDALGRTQPSFLGTTQTMSFTHTGFANFIAVTPHSTLERVRYHWKNDGLWRESFTVLDQAKLSKPTKKLLLSHVTAVRFEYLSKDGQLQTSWPPNATDQSLPKAVKMTLTLGSQGELSQFYLINATGSEHVSTNTSD